MTSPARHLAPALAAGCLLGLASALDPTAAALCLLLAGLAAWVWLGRRSRAAWLGALAGAGCALGVLLASTTPAPSDMPPGAPVLVAVRGTVTAAPDTRHDRPDGRGRDGARQTRFRATISGVDPGAEPGGTGAAGAVVHLRHREGEEIPALLPGDRIRAVGWIGRLGGPGNPGEVDHRLRAAREGITHRLVIPSPGALVQERPPGGAPPGAWTGLRRIGERIRRVAGARIDAACGPQTEAAGLLRCLLVGNRDGVPESLNQAFRRSGTAHLLAVSGLHVVLLTAVLARVAAALSPAWLRRRAGLPALLALLLLYCAVCRFATPVVRASVFLAVGAVARLAVRRTRLLDQLALAACIILAADPAQVADTGFHLSFAAVAGLGLLTGRFREALFPDLDLLRRFPEGRSPWELRARTALADGLSAACAAHLATAPIVACAFGALPPLGPLTNLLAVPMVAVLLPTAGVLAVAGGAAAPLSAPGADLVTLPLRALVSACPQLPAPLAAPGAPPVWVALAAGLVLLAGALIPHWKRRHLLLPLGAWALLLVHPYLRAGPTEPAIWVLDVGHGAAVLVRGGSGTDILYDAGGRRPDTATRRILPALRSLGLSRLDAVLVSHEDADHVGGVGDVVEGLSVGEVIVPAGFGGSPHARDLIRRCAERGVPVRRMGRGDRLVRRDLEVVVLHPPPDTAGPAENTGSLVVHVTAGPATGARVTALLTGDVEGPALAALAADPTVPAARLLVLPHHGLGDPVPQLALARRTGASVLVAGAPARAPVRVPGALVTGRAGAILVRPGAPPWNVRGGTRREP